MFLIKILTQEYQIQLSKTLTTLEDKLHMKSQGQSVLETKIVILTAKQKILLL